MWPATLSTAQLGCPVGDRQSSSQTPCCSRRRLKIEAGSWETETRTVTDTNKLYQRTDGELFIVNSFIWREMVFKRNVRRESSVNQNRWMFTILLDWGSQNQASGTRICRRDTFPKLGCNWFYFVCVTCLAPSLHLSVRMIFSSTLIRLGY